MKTEIKLMNVNLLPIKHENMNLSLFGGRDFSLKIASSNYNNFYQIKTLTNCFIVIIVYLFVYLFD